MAMSEKMNRRGFIKNSLAATAGAAVALSLEEKILLAREGADPNEAKKPKREVVKGLQTAKIGNVTLSRLICGGNLLGGWAHSRDLLYVSDVMKAYNTDEKILDTLEICEENGVNTILIHPSFLGLFKRYWKERGGKIQVLCECHPGPDEDIKVTVNRAFDCGACMIYIQGGYGDRLLKGGRIDIIGNTVEYIKQKGVPAGVGGHTLQIPMECEKIGIEPDFYVKTLHHDKYWSANAKEDRIEPETGSSNEHNKSHDNMWCINPEETIEFMKKVEKPWIGFKVLAAGAIPPQEGFKFAFENGADIICVGMFDFQVKNNVAIAKNAIDEVTKNGRARKWMA
jgi:hypothetical protein